MTPVFLYLCCINHFNPQGVTVVESIKLTVILYESESEALYNVGSRVASIITSPVFLVPLFVSEIFESPAFTKAASKPAPSVDTSIVKRPAIFAKVLFWISYVTENVSGLSGFSFSKSICAKSKSTEVTSGLVNARLPLTRPSSTFTAFVDSSVA